MVELKSREADLEIHFKDTFRAFSKDEDGKDKSESFKVAFGAFNKD